MAVSVYIDITAGGKLQSHGNSTAKKNAHTLSLGWTGKLIFASTKLRDTKNNEIV